MLVCIDNRLLSAEGELSPLETVSNAYKHFSLLSFTITYVAVTAIVDGTFLV